MDPESLLRELVAAWGETHARALAPAIAQLGAQVARARGSIIAPNPTVLESEWHRIAKLCDPCDLDRLLAARLPRRWKAVRTRLEALARFPPDPRIGEIVGGWATRFPQPEVQPMIAALIAEAPDTGDADAALLERARKAIAPSADLDALWAQHAANPDDLQQRLVLADALQQANDPRGEFIAAQMAIADGAGTKALRVRVDELLHANLHAWMGKMPWHGKHSVRFERGFLVGIRTGAGDAQLLESRALPQWRTVEDLDYTQYYTTADLTPLLASAPRLARITARPEVFDKLAKTGPHPQIRDIQIVGEDWIPPPNAFPNLDTLGGRYPCDSIAAARKTARALRDRVRVLVIPSCWREWIPHLVRARIDGPPQLVITSGISAFAVTGWTARFARDTQVAEIAWSGGRPRSVEIDDCALICDRIFDGGIPLVRIAMPTSDVWQAALQRVRSRGAKIEMA